jgi:hypothetical protein
MRFMEFDHVIRVNPDGSITERLPRELDAHAPDLYMDTADDEVHSILAEHEADYIAQAARQGWTLLSGFSNQDRYRGPLLHVSESVGCGLEDYIRATPGYYVAIAVSTLDEDDDDSDAGWVVAYREDLTDPWMVSDSGNAPAGQRTPTVGPFASEAAAAEFISSLPGAKTGRYSIDGPRWWDGQRTYEPVSWTRADSLAANTEGWDLFDCDGSDNGPLQLCKIDEPELWAEDRGVVISRTWEDDTDAWVFVARNPSDLHGKALALVQRANPVEREAIREWLALH